MTISLVGIGGLQWYWVKNALKMEASRFDEAVNEAMNEVVEELESQEALNFVREQVPSNSDLNVFFERAFSNEHKEIEEVIVVNSHEGEAMDNIQIIVDDVQNDETIWLEDSTQMLRTIRNTTINNGDSVTVENTTHRDGHSTYQIKVVEELMGDVIVEYMSIDDPIKSRLEGVELDSLIHSKLAIHAVEAPFQYAVTDAKGDSILTTYSSKDFEINASPYSKSLFQNDMIQKENALLVSFPNKSSYILQSMSFMFVLLIGFTLFIIASFAYTIFSILRQKRLSEVKTEFINNMTHEFKTPLATISIASDSINHPDVIDNPEKIKHFTNLIKEERKRLNMHVERVLQAARLEKGEIHFNLGQVDINDLIHEAVNTMQLQLTEKNGEIDLNLSQGIPSVVGDQFHLLNVLVNILDNSIKYSVNPPVIQLSSSMLEGVCNIKIVDQGKGMSKEVLKNVFKTFYRAESGDQHNVKGFGLGLSYARAVVEKHGGNIKISSEVDNGTSVNIFIPYSSNPSK